MIRLLTAIVAKTGQRQAILSLRAWSRTKNLIAYKDWNFFQQVFVELSTVCNRRCEYCPVKLEEVAPQAMTESTFAAVLDRLRAIKWSGIVGYTIFNEPLLNIELLCKRIRQTKTQLPNAIPLVFSNGDKLTEAAAEVLIAAGLKRCTITRHPPFSAEWDERVIPIIRSNRKVFRLHHIGPDVRMNVAGLTEGSLLRFDHCLAPTFALPIRTNGDVSLCCCDYRHEMIFGNVLKSDLLTIWGSKDYSELRCKLRKGERPLPQCKNCSGVV